MAIVPIDDRTECRGLLAVSSSIYESSEEIEFMHFMSPSSDRSKFGNTIALTIAAS